MKDFQGKEAFTPLKRIFSTSDPYLCLTDPAPGAPKTSGFASGSESGSRTLLQSMKFFSLCGSLFLAWIPIRNCIQIPYYSKSGSETLVTTDLKGSKVHAHKFSGL
jgi:hypothetical protein